jgi:hypothetical protein
MDNKKIAEIIKWIDHQVKIMEQAPYEWNEGYCYGLREVRDLLMGK